MQKKSHSFFGGTGFYITLACCLVAAGILGARFLLPGEELVAEEPVVQAQTPPSREVHADVPLVIEKPGEETEPVEPTDAEEPPSAAGAASIPQTPTIVPPLTGSTIAAFSSDELIYNEALADWRTHNGVDIAAEEGAEVCAACAGIVRSVSDDALMGVTVVIEHDGGFASTYANLAYDPCVSAGDEVKAGDAIGAVGTTADAESATPHLHFSVSRNGELIDPSAYLDK